MVTQKRGLVHGVVPVLQPVAVRAVHPGGTAQGVVGIDVAPAVGEVPVTPQLPGVILGRDQIALCIVGVADARFVQGDLHTVKQGDLRPQKAILAGIIVLRFHFI